MKTIVRKAYWSYEKEEKWLNEMSAKGLALTDYSWCRYVFSDSQPGEYTYRIELFEHLPSHPDSQKYLHFMEENGVEHIASYLRWVYFRKKACDGVFNIYSDLESRIKHYQRIIRFWIGLSAMEFLIGFANVYIGIDLLSQGNRFYANLVGGGLCVLIGIGLFLLANPLRKKARKLKRERLAIE
jgi:hypothetical protein